MTGDRHTRAGTAPATSGRRRRRGALGVLIPAVVLTAVALTLVWLNRSPWWGWGLVLLLIAGVVAGANALRRQRALLRVGAWLLATALVSATAVLAYPPAETRAAGGADPEPTALVPTLQGPVQGVRNDARTVEVFAGIPYAAPPVGELRWRAPQPPAPRAETLVADRFSAVPVQSSATFATRALTRVVKVPLAETLVNPYPVSEDSLTLNIWRPAGPADAALPVLVYIPGGGFATGSGALPLYDGEALASSGEAITVTLNYRLGVLGFLSHPELAQESGVGASGNYGILDQIAALEWVRDNIAGFGGDPMRVTVAGESAGGESVCILGATPLAEDLFDGIIASSGACMGTTGDTENGDQFDTADAAEEAGTRLSAALGDATIDEMRAMPAHRIVEAAADLAGHWRPAIDGHVLPVPPAEIYAAGDQHAVPILVGSNADEASLALALAQQGEPEEYRTMAEQTYGPEVEAYLRLYPGDSAEQVVRSTVQAQTDRVMTRAMSRWAHLHTRSGSAAAYLYFFSYAPPEPGLERYGAYHGAELAYAYDNLGADSAADYTAHDYRLRDRMRGYWLSFVRTGDPDTPGEPPWPPVAAAPQQVMHFGDDGGGMIPHPRADVVDFWLRYDGPVS